MRNMIVFVCLVACAGKAPPNVANNPDADMTSDAPPAAALTVSGKSMDYFGNVIVAAAQIATDGIDPPVMTTSSTDATYSVEVQVGSKLFLVATLPSYRPTRNAAVSVADMPVMQDVYVLSIQDVKNQYTVLGKLPTAGTAFVAAELRKNNGSPLEGIPLANVTLLDAQNNTQISVVADGATLAVSGGAGMMGGTPPTPSFATDIYPRLQRAAQGGLGCANCHTASGPAAVLPYDDTAATVLSHMKAITGVIDLATPANSLFLHKPLYEPPPTPQDHPNATFLDVNDPDYKLLLSWITQGAKP